MFEWSKETNFVIRWKKRILNDVDTNLKPHNIISYDFLFYFFFFFLNIENKFVFYLLLSFYAHFKLHFFSFIEYVLVCFDEIRYECMLPMEILFSLQGPQNTETHIDTILNMIFNTCLCNVHIENKYRLFVCLFLFVWINCNICVDINYCKNDQIWANR